MAGLMHRNPTQTLLSTRQSFGENVTPHPLPSGGINAEGDQGTPNGHHDPGGGQPEGRTKGAENGDAGNGNTGPQCSGGALPRLSHQLRAREVARPRPPLDLPPRVGIGAITSCCSR